MVRTVIPKDYQMGEAAYAAFYHPTQVPFSMLGHDFQMRWVRAARAVAKLHDSFKISPNPPSGRQILGPEERRRRRLAYQAGWRERKRAERAAQKPQPHEKI